MFVIERKINGRWEVVDECNNTRETAFAAFNLGKIPQCTDIRILTRGNTQYEIGKATGFSEGYKRGFNEGIKAIQKKQSKV